MTTEQAYVPFVPVLQEFAQENTMTLLYNDETEHWMSPHYQLFWLNASGQSCFMYFHWLGDKQYVLRVLRWGTHRLLDEREWLLHADESAAHTLTAILAEAKGWADEPKAE
jgi:hypothetical protein